MDELVKTIRKVIPAVIKEINEERIPALETSWGRSFRKKWQMRIRSLWKLQRTMQDL